MAELPPDWNDLVGAIYDAAMDDALWVPAVDRIMAQVGASQSWMITPILDQTTFTPQLLASRVADDLWPLYTAHYWQHDHWALNAAQRNMVQSGVIFHGDEVIPRDEFRRSEIYTDLTAPREFEVLLCAVLSGSTPEQPSPTCLSLFRPPGAEAFSREEEQFIRGLLPHLQRSLRIRWQMGRRHEARSLREAALDHMAQAVALLDENGRVLFANRRAEAIFRNGDGPTAANGRLTAGSAPGANGIKEALRRACLGIGSSVRLESLATGQQWVVTFSPVRIPSLDLTQGARILVLIAEPGRPATEGLPHFAQLYGLTPAETRVLEQMLQLESTQDIADTLQITIKTLRSHLSTLFAKTGTSRQRELVRFFLAHPAVNTEKPESESSRRPL